MDSTGKIINLPVPLIYPPGMGEYDESKLFPGAHFVPATEAGFRTSPMNYEQSALDGKERRQMQATVWFLRYHHLPDFGLRAIIDARYSPMMPSYKLQQIQLTEQCQSWQSFMLFDGKPKQPSRHSDSSNIETFLEWLVSAINSIA